MGVGRLRETSEAGGSGHQWQVAATVALPGVLVKQAHKRGTYKLPVQTKVHVQGIYCLLCRKDYDRVGDQPCEFAESKDHLIGGPIGERRKRSVAL